MTNRRSRARLRDTVDQKHHILIFQGSGGRDLSGNKRTAAQSSDQTLDRTNEALAWSCMVIIS